VATNTSGIDHKPISLTAQFCRFGGAESSDCTCGHRYARKMPHEDLNEFENETDAEHDALELFRVPR
jgi:hypothetical protein